ncbi:hypothetical protein DRO38_05725, partial [Candidatus Bathyarchaeota archaeon]
CSVIDFSARKKMPRALYQGLEWVRYCVNRAWNSKIVIPLVQGHNCSAYFDKCYLELSESAKKKLKYFKKFVATDNEIKIFVLCEQTKHDGDYEYYRTFKTT